MATENRNYDAVFTAAFPKYGHKEFIESVFTGTPLLHYIFKNTEMYQPMDGGPFIVEPVQLRKNSTVHRNSGNDPTDVTHQDNGQRASYNPGMLTGTLVLTDKEKALTSGEAQIINLYDMKAADLAGSFNEVLSRSICSAQTDADNASIIGLQTLVPDSPGSATIGNISESTEPNWAALAETLASAGGSASFTTSNSGTKGVNKALIDATWGGTKKSPSFGVCDKGTYTAWKNLVGETERTLTPIKGAADLGIPHINHEGLPIMWDRHIGWNSTADDENGAGQDASTTQGRLYLINENYMRLYYHPDHEFVLLPPVRAVNGVASTWTMEFIGQFTRSGGRYHKLLKTIGA